MYLHSDYLKSVVFIGREKRKGGKSWFDPLGTGFILQVPLEDLPRRAVHYLVTAKHVLSGLRRMTRLMVRVNTKAGPSTFVDIGREVQWTDHPSDDDADIAVTRFEVNTDTLDYHPMDVSQLEPEPAEGVTTTSIGDEVMILGLFARMQGKERNHPILRIGNVAMQPEDRIPMKGGRSMRGLLLEVRSLGGLSGSPVLARPSYAITARDSQGRPTRAWVMGDERIIGLVHGHWQIDPRDANKLLPRVPRRGARPKREGPLNFGIAVAVDARTIRETLNHPELVERRAEIAAATT